MRLELWRLSVNGFAALLVASGAFAAPRMNEQTHDLVIEKLERALGSAKEDETVSLVPVRARLADLYAERARLKALTEGEKSCSDCQGSREDRVRALKLYAVVESEAPKEQKGPILLQMAHLYRAIGEPAKAALLYERIVKEGERLHTKTVLSQGYASRGESYFAKGDFTRAQNDFESAVRLAPVVHRGPLVHRIAWCQLNRGEQHEAVASLIRILETPELLLRETTDGPMLDASFQDDVSQDLATFLARAPVGPRQIAQIEELSSERAKRDNLKRLASETERLGSKRSALLAWDAFLAIDGSDQDRIETLVRVARIRFDLGEKRDALTSLQAASTTWKSKGCKDEAVCQNLRLHLRRLVGDWNRVEKKKPTAELLSAYQAYLSLFEQDTEMVFWAALVARDLKRVGEALSLYHQASLLAAKPNPKAGEVPKNIGEILEFSLVGEVEMAELSSRAAKGREAQRMTFDLRQSAYDHYLKLSVKGAIAHQVRYQRARLAYERGEMAEAVKRLEQFAMSDTCRAQRDPSRSALCVQAADLDLDARVLLKDDRLIEAGALAYAQAYAVRRDEYLKIARTAGLRLAEKMGPVEALVKLASIDIRGAGQAEKISLLKTRLGIAEKAKELSAARAAANEMLALKGLSADDREFALSRLAWAAEMSFDFAETYRIAQLQSMKNLKPADRELRLALLAELSGRNPRQHEEGFLKLSNNPHAKALVRAKLVRRSQDPRREFRRHEQELRGAPAARAALALEIFASTKDRSFAEHALRDSRIARDPAGQAIQRHLFFTEFAKLDSRVAAQSLQTGSDRLLKTTLARRLALLSEIDEAANRAIGSRDWAAQVRALSVVSRENLRLAQEILNLPVPVRLKGKERETYMKLVEDKAKVFHAKHQAVEEKLKTLWKDESSAGEFARAVENTRAVVRALLARDLRIVAEVAPFSVRRNIEGVLEKAGEAPDLSAVASAMHDAKERPFNERRLARLREIESERGRETMVAYLDARLAKLKEGEAR